MTVGDADAFRAGTPPLICLRGLTYAGVNYGISVLSLSFSVAHSLSAESASAVDQDVDCFGRRRFASFFWFSEWLSSVALVACRKLRRCRMLCARDALHYIRDRFTVCGY